MIRVAFWPPGRGTWDEGCIEAAIAGTLWPTPTTFEVVSYGSRDVDMVVLHGAWAAVYDPLVPAMPSMALVIHASDEDQVFDSARLLRSRKTWVMYLTPEQEQAHGRKMVPGWNAGVREIVRAGIPRRPLTERRYRWGFAGQSQNASRQSMLAAVRDRRDGEARVSTGFSLGMPREEYLAFMGECAIALSPAGNKSPEGFRFYEALELGCLPIVQRSFHTWPPGLDYWAWMGIQPEFPVVDRWSEVGRILDGYTEDPTGLQHDANLAGAWWLKQKRQFVADLVGDLRGIGASVEPELKTTVLISASPVPSHPSTSMIEDTIARVRAYPEFARSEVIIMLDGVSAETEHMREAYVEHTRRLVDLCQHDPRFFGCLPMVFGGHVHQSEMTRQALKLVTTPLVFFVEHDTHPVGEIDFTGIQRVLLETEFANAIRLHVFHEVLPEHRAYYTDGVVNDVGGVPLIRTVDWSQRPHLAKTDWYRKMLDAHVPVGKQIWIEHAWYGPVRAAEWEAHRVCIYAPPGNMTRSGHVDGRRLGAGPVVTAPDSGEWPEDERTEDMPR